MKITLIPYCEWDKVGGEFLKGTYQEVIFTDEHVNKKKAVQMIIRDLHYTFSKEELRRALIALL